jgi:hypothetical protein
VGCSVAFLDAIETTLSKTNKVSSFMKATKDNLVWNMLNMRLKEAKHYIGVEISFQSDQH